MLRVVVNIDEHVHQTRGFVVKYFIYTRIDLEREEKNKEERVIYDSIYDINK